MLRNCPGFVVWICALPSFWHTVELAVWMHSVGFAAEALGAAAIAIAAALAANNGVVDNFDARLNTMV